MLDDHVAFANNAQQGHPLLIHESDKDRSHMNLSQVFELAVRHHREGSLHQAELLYRQILQSDPQNSDTLRLLGVMAHQVGRNDLAIEYLQQALRIHPEFPEAHYDLGLAWSALGTPSEAAASYRRALFLKPDFAEAHYNLGNVLKLQGQLEEAVACYRQVADLKPEFAEAHYNLGNARLQQGRFAEAVASFQQTLRSNPNFPGANTNLGNALYYQGKFREAATHYQQALDQSPNHTEACNLANAMFHLGKYDEAVACYRHALRLKPDCPEAYYGLGNAFYQQEKVDDAAANYQQALRLKPDYAEEYSRFGYALFHQGKFDEAAANFRQALRLNPEMANACYGLGNALYELGNLEGAIANYQKALRLAPGFVEAHNNLGTALLDRGAVEDAIDSYRQALCVKSDSGLAWCNLSQSVELDGPEIRQIESLLEGNALAVLDRSMMHRALAVFHDKRQNYDLAFGHFRQANNLRQQDLQQTGNGFDHAAFHASVNRYIATFDESFFRHQRTAANASELPVFVIGMMRSGTTLVEQILASHSQIFGAGELHALPQIVDNLGRLGAPRGGYPECMPSLEPADLENLAERHLAFLSHRSGGAVRVIDKLPGNFMELGLVSVLFPGARVIHCKRDPLDVCLSCYFQNLSNTNYSTSLEDLGCYYREYERLMAHWRQTLPLRMLEVQYEDLVAQQETVSRTIVSFCGLEWEEGCLAFYKNRRPIHTPSVLQVRQPIYSRSIGRWRNYANHLRPLLAALGQGHAAGTGEARFPQTAR